MQDALVGRVQLLREDLVDSPVLACFRQHPESSEGSVVHRVHQYAMMGLTACSCAALVAHFQMLMSACLRAGGMASAMAIRCRGGRRIALWK